MATLWRLARVLWAGILVTACMAPPEFLVPLGDPGAVEIDQRLIGTWYGVSRCTEFTIGIFGNVKCERTGGPPAMLLTLNVTANPDGRDIVVRATALALAVDDLGLEHQRRSAGRVLQLQATAYPTLIDGVTYYNVRRHAGVGYDYTARNRSPHFIIARLELEGQDTLNVHILADLPDGQKISFLKRYANWPVDSELLYGYTVVDASRERIIAMLRTADRDSLFPYRIGPLRRLATSVDMTTLETRACAPDNVRRAARFMALTETAYTLARLGLSGQARELAEEALEMHALGVGGGGQISDVGLGKAIEALAIAGDKQTARAALENTLKKHGTDPPQSIMCAHARLGPIPDVIRLARQLTDDFDRTEALRCIAAIQAETGDQSGALKTARSTGESYLMTSAAYALNEAGSTPAALELLKDASAASDDPGELTNIARNQAAWGDADAATRTLRRAAGLAGGRDRLDVAELQADIEDIEGARTTLEPALREAQAADIQQWPPDPAFDRSGDIPRIIALLVRLGERAEAIRIRDKLIAYVAQQGQHLSEYSKYNSVALAHAAMGDLPAAPDEDEAEVMGVDFLYEIAAMQHSIGDASGASQTLKLAFGKVLQAYAKKDAHQAWMRGEPMDRARSHLDAGDQTAAAFYIALATETALRAWEPWWQVNELLKVAAFQQDLGDMGGARSTALHGMSIAQGMPLMEPCNSSALLSLLILPELNAEARQ